MHSNCFAKTKVILNDMDNFNFTQAMLKNDRYYIPANSLSFIINARYAWNGEQKILTILWRSHEINFNLNSNRVVYDDTEIQINASTFIVDSQFYIPVSVLEDLFSVEVIYDKEYNLLKLYPETKVYIENSNNPFENINKISKVDRIDYYNIEKDISINIIDKYHITSILNEYFNNSYNRLYFPSKQTTGYKYYLDLYSMTEKILRIWIINDSLISLINDNSYYELENPLIYDFNPVK